MKLSAGILLLTLSLTACEKLHPGMCGDEKSPLAGKWKYVEQFSSSGGPGVWSAVTPAGQSIEFKDDGRFSSAASFQQEAKRYELLSQNRVKIFPVSNEVGFVVMSYTLSNSEKELQLIPVEPSKCIEGCASKFVRN